MDIFEEAGHRLAAIADGLKRGEPSPQMTVRQFLSFWAAQRRGYWIVGQIKGALQEAGLDTVPDFESAFIDAIITFKEAAPAPAVPIKAETIPSTADVSPLINAYADPTFRLSKLAAANRVPVSVKPDDSLECVVTVMMVNQFSQVPVMTTEREVKGIVTWASIGRRLALGQTPASALAVMDGAAEITSDSSLFAALPVIVEHGYVLVRASDKRVVGIVTATDISVQFQQLAEPFLLLGEIENHLRRIIGSSFTPDELTKIQDPNDPDRKINDAADLTFGEYCRLLEDPIGWAKTKIKLDRRVFVATLDRVRLIRNDVMHFDPDGITGSELEVLRDVARFMAALQKLGVT